MTIFPSCIFNVCLITVTLASRAKGPQDQAEDAPALPTKAARVCVAGNGTGTEEEMALPVPEDGDALFFQ